MKATSRSIEDYLYTQVLLPLKGIHTDAIATWNNPFADSGMSISLSVRQEPLTENTRHNYQRRNWEETADYEIILTRNGVNTVLGNFDRNNRIVKLFYETAKLYKVTPVLGKLEKMLRQMEPYAKVFIVKDEVKEYKRVGFFD